MGLPLLPFSPLGVRGNHPTWISRAGCPTHPNSLPRETRLLAAPVPLVSTATRGSDCITLPFLAPRSPILLIQPPPFTVPALRSDLGQRWPPRALSSTSCYREDQSGYL